MISAPKTSSECVPSYLPRHDSPLCIAREMKIQHVHRNNQTNIKENPDEHVPLRGGITHHLQYCVNAVIESQLCCSKQESTTCNCNCSHVCSRLPIFTSRRVCVCQSQEIATIAIYTATSMQVAWWTDEYIASLSQDSFDKIHKQEDTGLRCIRAVGFKNSPWGPSLGHCRLEMGSFKVPSKRLARYSS